MKARRAIGIIGGAVVMLVAAMPWLLADKFLVAYDEHPQPLSASEIPATTKGVYPPLPHGAWRDAELVFNSPESMTPSR
jgi:hypothetical protein